MQFRHLALAGAAASLAHAQTAKPSLALTDPTYAGITAGQPFTITWEGAEGDVTLLLLDDADPNNNHAIATIASGVTGTSFAWTPSETLLNLADYAIQIQDSVTSNDGAQFQLIGGATAPASGASTATATEASTTAAATTSSAQSTTLSTSTTPTSTAAPSTSAATTSFSNSTMTHSKTSSSSPSSTSPATGSQTSAPSAANNLASPLALIFLTVAALFTLN